jgi:polysaccharide biosynthesis transport protein
VLAFLLALLAGIIIAVLLESRDKSVRSYADVEGRLQQTLLGMVPLLKGKRDAFHGNAFFASGEPEFSESIRSIRTAVSLSSRGEPCKVIIVTSSLGREGKSTVAMNLAHAFAQNEKALLLDADLRRSSLASALNLPGTTKGLVELLEGEAQLADLVIPGEAGKADVMMHGSIPQDPQRLLSGSRMADALQSLQREYDRIIIDTPPVLPVRDALLLSRLADAVIVVAKADSTPRPQIEQALQLLARVEAPVVGIVVTQLDVRKAEKYSDYGYGGYYGSYGSESTPR